MFAEHPQCPRCGGRRTQSIAYGMPVDPQSWGPWISMGGCCVMEGQWHCSLCEHAW
ncbi:alkylphosphonate transporter [Mycobacterium sp. PS03-16]|nr:alkylphosphonate transporter [Mycobacterium sp. PS03-16]